MDRILSSSTRSWATTSSRRTPTVSNSVSRARAKRLPALGTALIGAGAWDDAKTVLSEATGTAQRIGDHGAAADARVGLVFIEMHTDAHASHAKARAELEQAIHVFEALNDKSGL